MKALGKIVIAAAGTAVAVGFAGSPAWAATTSFNNTKVQVLAANPVDDPESCQTVSIDLTQAGTYSWSLNIDGAVGGSKPIQLKASEYTWKMCLDPNPILNSGWGYAAYSWLTPTTGATANLGGSFQLSETETYQWGSTLKLVPAS